MFETNYAAILDQLDLIDPIAYGRTRNFIDGAVTKLSPYISRGVISTQQVMKRTLRRGFEPERIEKFLQELAWRDYWQQIWLAKGRAINQDLKRAQPFVQHHEMPTAIVEAETGIMAIDQAIQRFYETGYLHNHVRMYIASIACNIGRAHWLTPARWMYFHLLDGDWASNALSWQWVAGSNSGKQYYANQSNINKYCYSSQESTFLDLPYEDLVGMEVPTRLKHQTPLSLKASLPHQSDINVDSSQPSLIFNYYHLDPTWKSGWEANRILLIEPSTFENYPISKHCMQFMLKLSTNIPGIQVFVGEFQELVDRYALSDCYFKEHPLNQHYSGTEEPRDWMFGIKGYFPSFFAFWKKCSKELKSERYEA